MTGTDAGLQRFVDAQGGGTHEGALAELRAGRKRGHWIWYVLPQLAGLGSSPTSQHYGVRGLAEARAYLAHPVLGPRLRECAAALADLPGRPVTAVESSAAVGGGSMSSPCARPCGGLDVDGGLSGSLLLRHHGPVRAAGAPLHRVLVGSGQLW